MENYEALLPAYPYQNSLTKEIRQVAAKQNNKEYMSLWAGQSPRLSKSVTVQQLVNHLIEEANSIQLPREIIKQ